MFVAPYFFFITLYAKLPLRSHIQEIGRLTEEEDGPPPFRKVFKAADRRGLGTLPPLAFRRCLLEELGFDLTEAECEALLEYLVR